MSHEQEIKQLISDAEALLERLDAFPSSPAAAHLASAIDALQRLREAQLLPPGDPKPKP